MTIKEKFAVANIDLRGCYEMVEQSGTRSISLYDTLEAANQSILEDYAETLTVYAESLKSSGTSATMTINSFDHDDLPVIEYCAIPVQLDTQTGEVVNEHGEVITHSD